MFNSIRTLREKTTKTQTMQKVERGDSMVDRTKQRIERLVGIVDKTIQRIAEDAVSYRSSSNVQRKLHYSFRVAITVLAVTAPALVTYQMRVDSVFFQIGVIVFTAVAGGAATLQAIFAWGEQYGRTRLAALALEELESDMKMRKEDILDSEDELKVYQQLHALNEDGARRHREIIRQQIEGEVSLVRETEKGVNQGKQSKE